MAAAVKAVTFPTSVTAPSAKVHAIHHSDHSRTECGRKIGDIWTETPNFTFEQWAERRPGMACAACLRTVKA
jgi:hypothetical protein